MEAAEASASCSSLDSRTTFLPGVIPEWVQNKRRRRWEGPPRRSLLEDIHRMIGDPAFNDMVFLCGHAETEVSACRMLVAARSPVLESMLLRSGMVETKQTRIPLPGIEPEIMHVCLEFIYTDTVQKTSWGSADTEQNLPPDTEKQSSSESMENCMKAVSTTDFLQKTSWGSSDTEQNFPPDTEKKSSWESMEKCMKAVSAADFLQIYKLAELALERLSWLCSSDEEGIILCNDLMSLADLIKLYSCGANVRHTHCNDTIDWFLVRLMKSIQAQGKWCLQCHSHLSEHGLVHLLQNLNSEDFFDYLSILEYARFHHLVRWCSARIVSRAADPCREEEIIENALSTFLPSGWADSESLDKPRSEFGDADADTKRVMQLLAKELLDMLSRMPLDMSRIPICILCNVIEPLQVVPPSFLLDVYRQQSLSNASFRWDNFGHGDGYEVDWGDDSLIAARLKPFQGFAKCSSFAKVLSSMSSHWEVVVLRRCKKLRVGFCCSNSQISRKLYNECLVGDSPDSLALDSDGTLHCKTAGTSGKQTTLCPAFQIKKGLRIGVHINKDSCVFSINGNNIGDAWPLLPYTFQRVYPAVSMQKPGKVQIKLLLKSEG